MTIPEHLQKFDWYGPHQQWLNEDSGRKAYRGHKTMEGADLHGANLRRADFSYADLTGANLEGADLSQAWLRLSDLSGANLRGTDFRGAELSQAKLTGADLTGANLEGADFSGAFLLDADLTDAKGVPSRAEAVVLLDEIRLIVLDDADKLEMDNWHSSCGTAHCIAGWAQDLKGLSSPYEGILAIWPASHMVLRDDEDAYLFLRDREYDNDNS